jgi:ATP-binding cassette subfamily F protein 3
VLGRLRIAKFSQHHVDQLNLNLTPVEFLQSKHPGREVQEYRAILGRFVSTICAGVGRNMNRPLADFSACGSSYALSGDVALQKIETLSGGQKSRVVFAHIAMIQPQIMVLDEPVNHLVRKCQNLLYRNFGFLPTLFTL